MAENIGGKKTNEKKEETVKKAAPAKKIVAKKETVGSAKKPAVAKKAAEGKKFAKSSKVAVAEKKDSTKAKKSSDLKFEGKSSSVKNVKKEQKDKSKNVDWNKTSFLKHGEVNRRWFILDASGKSLGRVAALAASMLRGKHKVNFTPNVDCGDSIIIVNCKDAVLTGKKLQQKVRYHHSGWMGGLKAAKYDVLMKKCPQKAMSWAVNGMLPHNKLGARMARHLHVYKDANHGHEAQKPEVFDF